MAKFQNEIKQLLEFVGGRENVATVTHCVTRMRFVLNDPSKADVEKIESISCVKGTFTQAGQFQVIIGNEVADFYKEFVAFAGITEASKEDAKIAAKQNMSGIQRAMAHLSEIFAPLIPALIAGGLILGFRNILEGIPMDIIGGQTLVEYSQFLAGINHFLWLIGEAIFHFLPVAIVWSVVKKMGGTEVLGIVAGITLVSPQLMNAYAVAGADPATIPVWDFGFAQVEMIGYQAQVIPAIFVGFTLVYLERFFKKITHHTIAMIVVPLCSLTITVFLAHTILGPLGWAIGSAVSTIVYTGLTSTFNVLFAGIFGFFYAPLVITGLHHMTNAIDMQLIAEYGGTMLWPMIALSNIAQGSAVLAAVFIYKSEESRQISVPATISAYLGVTEPAMFGVNLKYIYPFLAAMIGSSIAAMISVGTGVMANSIGVGGIPGILSIQPEYWLEFAIAMAVAIVVPLVLTMVFHKNQLFSSSRFVKK